MRDLISRASDFIESGIITACILVGGVVIILFGILMGITLLTRIQDLLSMRSVTREAEFRARADSRPVSHSKSVESHTAA